MVSLSIYLGALQSFSLQQQQNVGLKMSTAVETDKMTALATAANEARGLAMDSIAAAHSGHMGLPLGAAEIGAVLYGSQVGRQYVTTTKKQAMCDVVPLKTHTRNLL